MVDAIRKPGGTGWLRAKGDSPVPVGDAPKSPESAPVPASHPDDGKADSQDRNHLLGGQANPAHRTVHLNPNDKAPELPPTTQTDELTMASVQTFGSPPGRSRRG